MRIPLSWLAEFVTWSRPAAALAELLTMAGVKIEAIEEVGRLDPRIVAGRRPALAAAPGADRPGVGPVPGGRAAARLGHVPGPGLRSGEGGPGQAARPQRPI